MDTNKINGLFDLICDDFSKMLKAEELSTADRKLLLEFLKDNDVTCIGKNNTSVKNIIDNLPFAEDVEQGRTINH